ncbi:peptidase S41 [Thiohalorhabdus denitrificans]|uniref:Carboxyl-terminal processing protease n=1 Tax=Thiohalorhabdus denitrificans TaxID=381306 RepID=A0A0P9C7X1_9GAMM|nr:S41 family peptidase [Thiohalorhabdus denitrificans]KPV41052.1 peptidase S41 [Thiohalorhabdus denitrificans]SCY40347.1 carboxyl-terminal processing protease [Thiohalorhabdus denitrificans]
MKPPKRLQTFFVLMLGILIGTGLTLERISQAERGVSSEEVPIPYEQLQLFSEVYSQIKGKYVEDVSDEDLMKGAIDGMLRELDPHSSYLTRDMLGEMQVETEGKFGGLGIEVTTENGFIKVVSPIDGTPADKAGLQAGDLIVRIDDTPTKDMNLMEAVDQMRGEPGSDIKLTVVREGFEQPRDFTVTRDVIRIESVSSRMLPHGVGYLRVKQFQQDTGAKVREHLNKLQDKRESGELRGLVLDLRNNPGGVLSAAVEVADAFVEGGKIVYTEGRESNSDMTLNANPDQALNGKPMVVLVNSGSASASEIVAGALQDAERALVVGTPTFGKGSVQSILELSDGSGLKLTTARYFTPAGRSIQAEGIDPDIAVKPLEVSQPEDNGNRLTERDLPGHLMNNSLEGEEGGEEGQEQSEEGEAPDYMDDYQLNQALNLLRGIILMESKQAS